MSYGFLMGFAQAKDLSEAMNLALEYVGMRMEPKRVTEELKRNIYYVPTISVLLTLCGWNIDTLLDMTPPIAIEEK